VKIVMRLLRLLWKILVVLFFRIVHGNPREWRQEVIEGFFDRQIRKTAERAGIDKLLTGVSRHERTLAKCRYASSLIVATVRRLRRLPRLPIPLETLELGWKECLRKYAMKLSVDGTDEMYERMRHLMFFQMDNYPKSPHGGEEVPGDQYRLFKRITGESVPGSEDLRFIIRHMMDMRTTSDVAVFIMQELVNDPEMEGKF
jgi:hypothetical protein